MAIKAAVNEHAKRNLVVAVEDLVGSDKTSSRTISCQVASVTSSGLSS